MPQEERKRKRPAESIQGSKRGPKPVSGPLKAPKSSARPIGKPPQQNLTLYDWTTVYAHVGSERGVGDWGGHVFS